MWPFILILAIVPMIFFWSDSVRTMFPALQKYLPEKSSTAGPAQPNSANLPPELAKSAEAGRWYVSDTKKGYVAWAMSADGQYRLAVGCRPDAQGSLQVTASNGATMPDGLHLNYQYGNLPLKQGYYVGPELINAVAQFKDVYLQTGANEVKAQFTVAGPDSNGVARDVQNVCASAAPATDSQ
jgi:hypothetical protein